MTIIHQGIRRRTTDVTDDYGQAYYAQNLRFRRVGEIGRRGGIGKTDMAQQAGPVLLIACGSYYETYVAQVIGGTVVTTLNPLAKWTDPIIIKPTGVTGNPAAPVIVSVTASPSTGVYVVGAVTMTAVVTYDGLSGALIYNFDNYTVTPGGVPLLLNDTVNPATYTFDGSCTPGLYSNPGVGLTVSTPLNGFSTTASIPNFTVL